MTSVINTSMFCSFPADRIHSMPLFSDHLFPIHLLFRPLIIVPSHVQIPFAAQQYASKQISSKQRNAMKLLTVLHENRNSHVSALKLIHLAEVCIPINLKIRKKHCVIRWQNSTDHSLNTWKDTISYTSNVHAEIHAECLATRGSIANINVLHLFLH